MIRWKVKQLASYQGLKHGAYMWKNVWYINRLRMYNILREMNMS